MDVGILEKTHHTVFFIEPVYAYKPLILLLYPGAVNSFKA